MDMAAHIALVWWAVLCWSPLPPYSSLLGVKRERERERKKRFGVTLSLLRIFRGLFLSSFLCRHLRMEASKWMLVMVLLISGLCYSFASSKKAATSPEERLLRGLEEGFERIFAQLRRLLAIVSPPTTTETTFATSTGFINDKSTPIDNPPLITTGLLLLISSTNPSTAETSSTPTTDLSFNSSTINATDSFTGSIDSPNDYDDSTTDSYPSDYTESPVDSFSNDSMEVYSDESVEPSLINMTNDSSNDTTDSDIWTDSLTSTDSSANNDSSNNDSTASNDSSNNDSSRSNSSESSANLTPSADLNRAESLTAEDSKTGGRRKRSPYSHEDGSKVREVRSILEKDSGGEKSKSFPSICIPRDLDDEDDLCSRLSGVLHGISNATQDVASGHATEDVLQKVESFALELKDLVGRVEKDPTFVEELQKEDFALHVVELQRHLSDAEKVLEGKLVRLDKISPRLVIILAAVGGAILVAMLGISGYALHKKRRTARKDELGNIRGTNIPVQSFKEAAMGHDNPSFQQELLRRPSLQDAPLTSIPRPRSTVDTFGRPPRPSSDPRGGGAEGRSKRTPSPYYSVPKPFGETQVFLDGSRGRPPSRVDEDDLNDPYSLEGRGHNVRRIHSGRLMRIDP